MLMHINGLCAEINLPPAPEGDGIHNLPPYDRQNVYKVDDYAGCPANWMNGSGKAASFFLPVDTGKHLWLDFNGNWNHSHHVAIVLSVQGINPITGLPTKSLRLEQYRDKCIIHGEDFGADRFCQKCNDNVPGDYDGTKVTTFPSKWPPQNYMTTVNHQSGQLWIDGWMAEDQTIRGFLITSETIRGIAQQIIGEDRVWAIGIAFYLSKEPKPPRMQSVLRTASFGGPSGQSAGSWGKMYSAKGSQEVFGCEDTYTCSVSNLNRSLSQGMGASQIPISESETMRRLRTAVYTPESVKNDHCLDFANEFVAESLVETEKLEIGAGAKIRQELCRLDPNEPSFYKDEPEGLLYINYCTRADFDKIMAAGKIDRTKGGEGFMSGLKTGN